MAYNWPSGHKAGTTTTDGATDKISDARADIQQNIVNVNEIIDMFDLASEPSNGQILKYSTTNDRFELGADASGGGGIALTDLSVTQNSASGGGTLAYNSSTGVFTYTPPASTSTIGTHDIWIPAQAMYPTADEGSSNLTTYEIVENRAEVRSLNFDKDSDEHAQFSIAMPKSWNEGTITFSVYWTALNGSAGQTVRWSMKAVAISDSDGFGTAFGTAQTIDDTLHNTNMFMHKSAVSSALTIGGTPAEGDVVFFQISRDVSEDNLADDARLLGVKIHYTTNAENDA